MVLIEVHRSKAMGRCWTERAQSENTTRVTVRGLSQEAHGAEAHSCPQLSDFRESQREKSGVTPKPGV